MKSQVLSQALAGAIEPFYGEAASGKLFELLAGHRGAISDYLDATRADSEADQDSAFAQVVGNANELAAFLGGANPHLPVDTLRGLLTAHGSHHVQQIRQFDAGELAQEAETWAMMKNHMYVIADALARRHRQAVSRQVCGVIEPLMPPPCTHTQGAHEGGRRPRLARTTRSTR